MDKVDIAEVLTHYGALHVPVSNRWRAMKCPFHEDRQASASVNTDKGQFKCFVCDYTGDGLDLIQKREGVDFAGSVEFAETVFGASLNGVRGKSQGRTKRRGLSEEPIIQRGQRTIVSSRVRRRALDGA